MDVCHARRLLDAVREGADISQASIREALKATGDLECSSNGHPKASVTPIGSHDIAPFAWQLRSDRRHDNRRGAPPATSEGDHLAAIKAILETPHGPIGMRPTATERRGKEFE